VEPDPAISADLSEQLELSFYRKFDICTGNRHSACHFMGTLNALEITGFCLYLNFNAVPYQKVE